MTSPMLEKIARAICRSFYSHDENEPALTAIVDGEWGDWAGEARAALLSLREPDEGMVEAWHRSAWPKGPRVTPLSHAGQAFVRNHTAMIDHVLESGS